MERISLKTLYRFAAFKVQWNCLDPQLCNIKVICPFAPPCSWSKLFSNQVPLVSRLCRTHISETAGWIYAIWGSVELYKLTGMQHHTLIFTVDLLGQILKKSITGGSNNMEWNGDSIRSGAQFVAFNLDLSHDFELEFSRPNFEKAVFQEWEGWLTCNKRDVSR